MGGGALKFDKLEVNFDYNIRSDTIDRQKLDISFEASKFPDLSFSNLFVYDPIQKQYIYNIMFKNDANSVGYITEIDFSNLKKFNYNGDTYAANFDKNGNLNEQTNGSTVDLPYYTVPTCSLVYEKKTEIRVYNVNVNYYSATFFDINEAKNEYYIFLRIKMYTDESIMNNNYYIYVVPISKFYKFLYYLLIDEDLDYNNLYVILTFLKEKCYINDGHTTTMKDVLSQNNNSNKYYNNNKNPLTTITSNKYCKSLSITSNNIDFTFNSEKIIADLLTNSNNTSQPYLSTLTEQLTKLNDSLTDNSESSSKPYLSTLSEQIASLTNCFVDNLTQQGQTTPYLSKLSALSDQITKFNENLVDSTSKPYLSTLSEQVTKFNENLTGSVTPTEPYLTTLSTQLNENTNTIKEAINTLNTTTDNKLSDINTSVGKKYSETTKQLAKINSIHYYASNPQVDYYSYYPYC